MENTKLLTSKTVSIEHSHLKFGSSNRNKPLSAMIKLDSNCEVMMIATRRYGGDIVLISDKELPNRLGMMSIGAY